MMKPSIDNYNLQDLKIKSPSIKSKPAISNCILSYVIQGDKALVKVIRAIGDDTWIQWKVPARYTPQEIEGAIETLNQTYTQLIYKLKKEKATLNPEIEQAMKEKAPNIYKDLVEDKVEPNLEKIAELYKLCDTERDKLYVDENEINRLKNYLGKIYTEANEPPEEPKREKTEIVKEVKQTERYKMKLDNSTRSNLYTSVLMLYQFYNAKDNIRFLTLTFDPEKSKGRERNLKWVKRQVNRFLRDLQKEKPNIAFIGVPEPHKEKDFDKGKGARWHIHGVLSNYVHYTTLNKLWKWGYTDIRAFKQIAGNDSPKAVFNYLMKYISKNRPLLRELGLHPYIATPNLKHLNSLWKKIHLHDSDEGIENLFLIEKNLLPNIEEVFKNFDENNKEHLKFRQKLEKHIEDQIWKQTSPTLAERLKKLIKTFMYEHGMKVLYILNKTIKITAIELHEKFIGDGTEKYFVKVSYLYVITLGTKWLSTHDSAIALEEDFTPPPALYPFTIELPKQKRERAPPEEEDQELKDLLEFLEDF